MVAKLSVRELSNAMLEFLKDQSTMLEVNEDKIVIGQYGEMPNYAPGIVIFPRLEGTTHAKLAQVTITIFCLETDYDQNEAMFRSIELAGRVLNALEEFHGLPTGAIIGFDGIYASIAASYIEYTLKVKVT